MLMEEFIVNTESFQILLTIEVILVYLESFPYFDHFTGFTFSGNLFC